MNVYERFSDRARGAVVLADLACRELGHDEVGSEHLLLGVVQEVGTAHHVLRAMGVNAENARATIVEQFGEGDTEPEGKLEYAEEAHAALETALREALGFRHELVGTEHLLLGLLRRSESRAVTVLHHLRVDPNSVRERVLDLIGAPGFVSPELPQHATSSSGIVSTGSGPVAARSRGDGIDIRALADEVTMLRAEIAALRATVHRLERDR
jgi:ATP-dependent Clp protease ATP-binding subunit ClpC